MTHMLHEHDYKISCSCGKFRAAAFLQVPMSQEKQTQNQAQPGKLATGGNYEQPHSWH